MRAGAFGLAAALATASLHATPIAPKEDPHKAYADVSRIWVPNPVWKRYIQQMLQKRGIAFEPY
jgi:hypothetical protein